MQVKFCFTEDKINQGLDSAVLNVTFPIENSARSVNSDIRLMWISVSPAVR